MLKLRRYSLPVLIAMLFTLTVVLLCDDILFYLLFERVFGFEISLFGKSVVIAWLTLLNLWLAFLVVKSASADPQTGSEGMLGETGTVKSVVRPFYWVIVRGELWRAQSGEKLDVGDEIVVRRLNGLTLEVTAMRSAADGEVS